VGTVSWRGLQGRESGVYILGWRFRRPPLCLAHGEPNAPAAAAPAPHPSLVLAAHSPPPSSVACPANTTTTQTPHFSRLPASARSACLTRDTQQARSPVLPGHRPSTSSCTAAPPQRAGRFALARCGRPAHPAAAHSSHRGTPTQVCVCQSGGGERARACDRTLKTVAMGMVTTAVTPRPPPLDRCHWSGSSHDPLCAGLVLHGAKAGPVSACGSCLHLPHTCVLQASQWSRRGWSDGVRTHPVGMMRGGGVRPRAGRN